MITAILSIDHENATKPTFTDIVVASTIGFIIAAALNFHLRSLGDKKIIPRVRLGDSGRAEKLERFSHYVARQMGFIDRRECPQLCKLASEYIRKSKGFEEDIYTFFSNEPDADSLFVKLVEEFERCILSYFAFHWKQTDLMITQVLSSDEPKRKLKNIVMAATREQRFERVTRNLKVARVFTTLVEEMKAMAFYPMDDSQCTEVMAPVAHSDRSPVLLFMGGGMGAGKSTVLKDIIKEPFWAGAEANAVVIEADAFKESDVIYKALSSRGHLDMLQTAELVHQSSTDAASSLLVTALNEGRDVIMDGTLSWVPFVVQTITMARNVHRRRYRMGPGYKVSDCGKVTEEYWELIVGEEAVNVEGKKRKPYRIELVGVVCDAYLAVARGIRRAIMCRRAVRVQSQLRSHKRFANAFMTYCNLVDSAKLYCTNALEGPPKMIGWKEKDRTLLVDTDEIHCLIKVGELNENADSIYDLYNHPNPACEDGSVWKDIVLSPSRLNIQQELKYCIQKVETRHEQSTRDVQAGQEVQETQYEQVSQDEQSAQDEQAQQDVQVSQDEQSAQDEQAIQAVQESQDEQSAQDEKAIQGEQVSQDEQSALDEQAHQGVQVSQDEQSAQDHEQAHQGVQVSQDEQSAQDHEQAIQDVQVLEDEQSVQDVQVSTRDMQSAQDEQATQDEQSGQDTFPSS